MKNIHLLPTDKPSRLVWYTTGNYQLLKKPIFINAPSNPNRNIYITSTECLKKGKENIGCYYLDVDGKITQKKNSDWQNTFLNDFKKKIILTTDPDLIKNGVQAIDDKFLEWFVKNPSCEEVEVERTFIDTVTDKPIRNWSEYKIIIPKEEPKQREMFFMNANTVIDTRKPKQETLEESLPKNRWKHVGNEETLEEVAKDYATNSTIEPSTFDENAYSDFIKGAKWQQERSYSKEEVDSLLNKLLEYNMCSHAGDELIEQFKKK